MSSLNVPLYDPRLVQPMREELTRLGFQELRTPDDVDAVLGKTKETALVVVNSVCGCAGPNPPPPARLRSSPPSRRKHRLPEFAVQTPTAPPRPAAYFPAINRRSPKTPR